MGQQVNVYRKLKIWPGAVVEGWLPDAPGNDYYVDTTNGADTYPGSNWSEAFATIGKAMTTAAALATRGRFRIFVAPGGYNEDVVTPLNTTGPFGALIGVTPTTCSFGGAYIYASTALTPGLKVRARGWLITGFELACIASAKSVMLDGKNTNCNAAGVEISDCLMGGWAATSGIGIDVIGNGAPHATLRNLHFDGYPGSAIVCTDSGTDQPRFWEIDECVFVDNSNHINLNPRGFKECLVHNSTFMKVGANRTATNVINNTGGNASIFTKNYLSGTYDISNGYVGAANDEWGGNFNSLTGGVTAADPA